MSKHKHSKTRKRVPWSGWSSQKPSARQKTTMKLKCGKTCFLGPRKSFPICKKNTCKISDKGLYSAYTRSREWISRSPKHLKSSYYKVASTAKKMLKRLGYKNIGRSRRRK